MRSRGLQFCSVPEVGALGVFTTRCTSEAARCERFILQNKKARAWTEPKVGSMTKPRARTSKMQTKQVLNKYSNNANENTNHVTSPKRLATWARAASLVFILYDLSIYIVFVWYVFYMFALGDLSLHSYGMFWSRAEPPPIHAYIRCSYIHLGCSRKPEQK